MNSGAETVLFLASLVLSVALGIRFKINVGIFAFLSAVLVGCLTLGMSISDIFALWPNNLFLTLLFVTYFFGFAVSNGTLDALAGDVVWLFRKAPALIPFALLFLVAFLAAIGISSYALFVFMAPPIMMVASKLRMHRLVGVCIVVGGGAIGGLSPYSQLGITMLHTLGVLGYGSGESHEILKTMIVNDFIGEFILFLFIYFVFKAFKIRVDESIRPAVRYTPEQKKTLAVLGTMLAAIVVIALMHTLLPGAAPVTRIYNTFDISFASVIGIVVCTMLKVAKPMDALAKTPLDSLILICCTSMLIGVGVKAGVVDCLSAWAAQNVSRSVAPYLVVVVSGVLSLFASAINVVVPTVGTIIPGLALAHGFTPGYLFSLSATMAMLTGYSPFSTGGSISLSGVYDEQERGRLFQWLLLFPAIAMAVMLLLTALGLWIS